MKRILVGLAVSMVLVIAATAPAQANAGHCTQGDAKALAQAGFQGASQFLGGGSTAGLGRTWVDCQFRLFDDNDEFIDDPEVPHVFTEKDYVLAGITVFEFYGALDRPDYDRAAAIEYVRSVDATMFWGTADTPDAGLAQIDLEQSPIRDSVFTGFDHIVGNQRYTIFEPGSLAPGEYKWRLKYDDPVFGSFEARGVVVILDA